MCSILVEDIYLLDHIPSVLSLYKNISDVDHIFLHYGVYPWKLL